MVCEAPTRGRIHHSPVHSRHEPAAQRLVDSDTRPRPTTAKVVRAECFELVDHEGTVRARLGLSESGAPRLALFDGKGRRRAALGLNRSGAPSLVFIDKTGESRAELAFDEEDETLVLYDENGDEIWCAA